MIALTAAFLYIIGMEVTHGCITDGVYVMLRVVCGLGGNADRQDGNKSTPFIVLQI